MSSGKLFLIPVSLGETNNDRLFPALNLRLIHELKYLVVENERSARRFIRSTGSDRDLNDVELILLDKRTGRHEISRPIELLLQGNDIGLMSEAGCPGVADPGQILIAEAHRFNVSAVPLIGPSSILLALMASGLNGQGFTFHGYLPIDKKERVRAIKAVDETAGRTGVSQLFMETPYRNEQMLDDILKHANGGHLLCIAADITLDTEFIRTLAVGEWKTDRPKLHKRPCIFILGK